MAHPREILKQLGASPLKALSQNFLTSPHWAEKLVEALLKDSSADEHWEVGPGLGALTEVLLEKSKKPVRLFEIDRKLSQYLRERFPQVPLQEGDFLERNIAEELSPSRTCAILSNLPYHLSSPMIFKMAEYKEQVTHFVFTFQKEFADRLTAAPGTKNYGALTVITELHFHLENLGTLPAGAFYPPPSVSSQAIRFTPRPNVPEEAGLVSLIKLAFAHRRKQLAGNLRAGFPQVDWEKALLALGKPPTCRAENLSLNDFRELFQYIH